MTSTDCKTHHEQLADAVLNHEGVSAELAIHLAGCSACQLELSELQATLALMDAWQAPEPSIYFDTRVKARLRAEQAAAPEGLWERLTSFLRYSTGRGFRPAMVGALGVAMLIGGGTAATLLSHSSAGPAASPTVNDLKIYDNNAQAVEQMDLLDDAGSTFDGAPQS